jgi:hypothetical protein
MLASYYARSEYLRSRRPLKNVNIKIQRTAVLPILFECETWSVVLEEEHRLRVIKGCFREYLKPREIK